MMLNLELPARAAVTLACLLLASLAAHAYTNPIAVPQQQPGQGVADPGLLRWMGKYYLYATKVVEDPGIRCWESSDLVNWAFKGFCTGDDPAFGDRMAWSPGPFYYNGKFYLYVCSSDQKHRVFAASQPTGPFVCVNDDLLDVRTLDAVAFLDDDGQLYLFYAGWGGNGIQYRTCSSPINADGENKKLGACQFSVIADNYWVEGPAMLKVDGVYYLTYCGNDWRDDNYQVRAASGRLIADLKPQRTNPIIAETESEWVATGCNWMVMGPDLHSLWNVYHCRRKGGHTRALCLDPIRVDPATGELLCDGPTWQPCPDPDPPAWQEAFGSATLSSDWHPAYGKWTAAGDGAVSGTAGTDQAAELACVQRMAPNSVAEFNIRLAEDLGQRREPAYGIVLTARDGERLGVLVNVRSKTLELCRQGPNSSRRIVEAAALPPQFDMDVWHTLLVDSRGGRLKIFFDSMMKIDTALASTGHSFALVAERCRADFGWCGVSELDSTRH